MQQRISCPNPLCPQPDDVQRVSAVVQSAMSQGYLAGQHGATSQSALSQLLAAPVEPVNRGGWTCASVFWMLILAYLAAAGLVVAILISAKIAVFPPDNGPPPDDLFAVGLGSVVILAWVFLYKRGRAARFKREYPVWVRAKTKWDELYYCHRCGSVFKPRDLTPTFVPASQMKRLLA